LADVAAGQLDRSGVGQLEAGDHSAALWSSRILRAEHREELAAADLELIPATAVTSP